MPNLTMVNVDFNFTCGAFRGFNLDGLSNYVYTPSQDTVALSDAISTQGTKVVKRFASKAFELTLSVLVGSDLDSELAKSTMLPGADIIGTLKDERRANSTLDLSFIGGLNKVERDYSADTTDYIIRGNLQTETIY